MPLREDLTGEDITFGLENPDLFSEQENLNFEKLAGSLPDENERQRLVVEQQELYFSGLENVGGDLTGEDKTAYDGLMLQSFTPDEDRARHANANFFSNYYSDITQKKYFANEDSIHQEYFGDKEIGALDAYGRIGEEVKLGKQKRTLATGIQSRAWDDAVKRIASVDGLNGYRDEIRGSEGYVTDEDAAHQQLYLDSHKQFTEKLAPLMPLAEEIYNNLAVERELVEGKEAIQEIEFEDLIQEYAALPRDQQDLVQLLIQSQGNKAFDEKEQGDPLDRGAWARLGAKISQTFGALGPTHNRSADNAGFTALEQYFGSVESWPDPVPAEFGRTFGGIRAGLKRTRDAMLDDIVPGWREKAGQPITDEERVEVLAVIDHTLNVNDARRDFENIANMSVDKIKGGFIQEKFIFPTVDSSVIMAQAAIPAVGLFMNASYENDRQIGEMRRLYPEMDRWDAQKVSMVGSSIVALGDKLELSFLMGKVPGLSGFFKASKANIAQGKLTSEVAKLIGKRLGVSFTGENIIEAGQDLTRPFVQHMFSLVNEDIPDVDLKKDFAITEFWNTRLDVAMGLMPTILIASGVAGVNDYRQAMIYMEDETRLKAIGIQDEDINTIQAETNPERKVEILQDAYENRRTKATAAEGIKQLEKEQDIRQEINDDPTTAVIRQTSDSEGNMVWEVYDPTGEKKLGETYSIGQAHDLADEYDATATDEAAASAEATIAAEESAAARAEEELDILEEEIPADIDVAQEVKEGDVIDPVIKEAIQSEVQEVLTKTEDQAIAKVAEVDLEILAFAEGVPRRRQAEARTELGEREALEAAGLDPVKDELLTVIRKVGGLIAPSAAKEKGEPLTGELESMLKGLNAGQRMKLFRKGGPTLDRLREVLNADYGFKFETPDELIHATNLSLTGKPQYPTYELEQAITPAEGSVLTPDEAEAKAPETIDSLKKKADELVRRQAAKAEQQPYTPQAQREDVQRGREYIMERLDTLMGFGRHSFLTRRSRRAIESLLKDLDNVLTDDVTISIRMGKDQRVQGTYNFYDGIVTLMHNAIRTDSWDHTFFHELFHHISKFVPAPVVEKLREQYNKETDAYIVSNPWFKPFVGRKFLTERQKKELEKFDAPAAKRYLEPVVKANGEQATDGKGNKIFRILFSDENYRYSNLDEWFAETMADQAADKYGTWTPEAAGVMYFARKMFKAMMDALKSAFGNSYARRVFDDIIAGRFLDYERGIPLQVYREDVRFEPGTQFISPTLAKGAGLDPAGENAFDSRVEKIKIQSPIRRLIGVTKGRGVRANISGLGRLLWEGSADLLERAGMPEARRLAQAIRFHTDYSDELKGRLSGKFQAVLSPLSSKKRKAVKGEWSKYMKARENAVDYFKDEKGVWQTRPNPERRAKVEEMKETMTPETKALIEATGDAFTTTGNLAQRWRVQVWDAGMNEGKGGYRQMGNMGVNYFPRMMRREVMEALQNPSKPHNRKLLDDIRAELEAQGRSEEEIAAILQRKGPSLIVGNDYFAQLEVSRNGQLPPIFYDYEFDNIIPRFILGYSERLAQIAAFGQKIKKQGGEPGTDDLFDEIMAKADDADTALTILEMQKQAYGWHMDSYAARQLARLTGFTVMSKLSNPLSAFRNLVSGVETAVELHGVMRGMKAIFTLNKTLTKLEAEQIGVIQANIMDVMFWGEHADLNTRFDQALRWSTTKGLQISGFSAAESFNRRFSAVVAMNFARDGIKAWKQSTKSLRAKEFIRQLDSLGISNVKAFVSENMNWKEGELSRKYLRRAVKESQGGYRYDMVPLWANGSTGRFLYQFGRWGTQRSRQVMRQVVVPLLGGNPMPFIRMMGGTLITGAIYNAIADVVFDREDEDANYDEIWREIKARKYSEAALAAANKLVNYVVMSGQLGIIQQPLNAYKEFTTFSRVRNPLDPAGIQIVKDSFDLLMSGVDQGTLTYRDIERFMSSTFAGPGNIYKAALTQASKFESDFHLVKLKGAWNTKSNMKKEMFRYAADEGIEYTRLSFGELSFRKSENTAFYNKVNEFIMTGNAVDARILIKEKMEGMTGQERKELMKDLKASTSARQPVKLGAKRSADLRKSFFRWAKNNLSVDEYKRYRELDATYYNTARRLRLMSKR